MSTQVGLIKLKGKMDGISFFQSEGKHFARMAKGPSKQRIMNAAEFARTRENNSEFGGSAKAAKAFRTAFTQVMNIADSRITSRLTSVFKQINLKGDGARGKRPINLSQHHEQLGNFEFNKNVQLQSFFTGLLTATNTPDRLSASVTIDNVLIRKITKAPSGATHVRLAQVLGVISDFAYDADFKSYIPVVNNFYQPNVITRSEYLSLNSTEPVSVILNSSFDEDLVLNDNLSIVQCFGISFYQNVETNYYPIGRTSAMKVLRVF